jgi:DNA-directed RNA polymerase subunit M
MKFTDINKKSGIPVIERDETMLPKTTTHCPECGHRKAWWWVQQSDEETIIQFFKCVRCRHIWREE